MADAFGRKPRVSRTPPHQSEHDSETDSAHSDRDKRGREEEESPREVERKKQRATDKLGDYEKEREKGEQEKKKQQEKFILQYRQRTGSSSSMGNRGEEKRMTEEIKKIQTEKEQLQRRIEEANRAREDPIRGKAEKIRSALVTIVDSVSKENGGKISVTRADQQAVKQAAMEIQDSLIGTLLEQLELYKEREKMIEEVTQVKEMLRQKGGNSAPHQEDQLEPVEKRVRRATDRNEINTEESDTDWQDRENRRGGPTRRGRGRGAGRVREGINRGQQEKTYAEISRGESSKEERIQGRRVIVEKEGWQ